MLGQDVELALRLAGYGKTMAACLAALDRLPERFTTDDLLLGMPLAERSGALRAIFVLCESGILVEEGDGWRNLFPRDRAARLSLYLAGIVAGIEAAERRHRSVAPLIAMTSPRKPSLLFDQVKMDPSLAVNVEQTAETFMFMASCAAERFTILTPFLDESGAEWVLGLLRMVPEDAKKVLILRYVNPSLRGYPEGYDLIAADARSMDVDVYDFGIQRDDGQFETFHAKVVCSDGKLAYVGSSNMTSASKNHSMELGVVVRGREAGIVAGVLQKISSISKKIC